MTTRVYSGIIMFYTPSHNFGVVLDIAGRSRRFYESALDGLTLDDLKPGLLVDFAASSSTVMSVKPFTQPLDCEDALTLKELMDEVAWKDAQKNWFSSNLIKYDESKRSN